jgi:iodotyrosine deiodinase
VPFRIIFFIKMSQEFPNPKFIPLEFQYLSEEEQLQRVNNFFNLLNQRRTVREYSKKEVPFDLIEKAIQMAGTVPSGANLQPWQFIVIKDPIIKRKIPKMLLDIAGRIEKIRNSAVLKPILEG